MSLSLRATPLSAVLFFFTLALSQTALAAHEELGTSSVDQQLAELDQRFDSGEYGGSVRNYLTAQADLAVVAATEGDDLTVRPDPEPVDVEERVRAFIQAKQAEKYIEQERLEELCAPLATVCPDEPLAKLASAADIFSISRAANTAFGLDFEFAEPSHRPMTLAEFQGRRLRQTGADFLGYMGVSAVIFGAAIAVESAPIVALGTSLEAGTVTTGAGSITALTGASVPALAVEVPAVASVGTGGILTTIASSSASRYVLAAAAGGSAGLEGVGMGGALSLFNFGQATPYLAGACATLLLTRGCGKAPDLTDNGLRPVRSIPTAPLTTGGQRPPSKGPSKEELQVYHDYTREHGLNPWIYDATNWIATQGLRVRGFTVTGQENVPIDGTRPVIFVANHASYWDLPAVHGALATVPGAPRPNSIAKAQLFPNRFIGGYLNRLGGFPVMRGEKDRDSLETSLVILGRNGSMLVFPTGTRTPGEVGTFKEGAAKLALQKGAIVVPIGINGSRGWGPINVCIGTPLCFTKGEIRPDAATLQVQAAIASLMTTPPQLTNAP